MQAIAGIIGAVFVLIAAQAVPARADDGHPGRGKTLAYALDCVNCHGTDGAGTRDDRPNLGGQQAAYLKKQILAFKYGHVTMFDTERGHVDMTDRAAEMTDQQAADLASFYSARPCADGGAASGADVEKPTLAARCESCHGKEGAAPRTPMVPRLAGQKAEYLMNQIAQFQKHSRDETPEDASIYRAHPMMERQTMTVSPGEARRLVAYFASRRCR